jgi:hypothetical protein
MNHSFYSADRSTHLKIVVAALVVGIVVSVIAHHPRPRLSADGRRYQSRKAGGHHQFEYFGYSLIAERVAAAHG